MPKRPSPTSRWLITASWPLGVALTSWDYMWRTTPMWRREAPGSLESPLPALLSYPAGVSSQDVQGHEDGYGPLFHRRYRTRIRGSSLGAAELMGKLQADLNRAAPTKFARFQMLRGERGGLSVGDEYVVRMPGPWDGPVRVVGVGSYSFRLATLAGHLEAGQIEFRRRGRRFGPRVRDRVVGPQQQRTGGLPLPPSANGQGGAGAHVDFVPGARGASCRRSYDGRDRA